MPGGAAGAHSGLSRIVADTLAAPNFDRCGGAAKPIDDFGDKGLGRTRQPAAMGVTLLAMKRCQMCFRVGVDHCRDAFTPFASIGQLDDEAKQPIELRRRFAYLGLPLLSFGFDDHPYVRGSPRRGGAARPGEGRPTSHEADCERAAYALPGAHEIG
jgi:hypothetical protein